MIGTSHWHDASFSLMAKDPKLRDPDTFKTWLGRWIVCGWLFTARGKPPHTVPPADKLTTVTQYRTGSMAKLFPVFDVDECTAAYQRMVMHGLLDASRVCQVDRPVARELIRRSDVGCKKHVLKAQWNALRIFLEQL